MKKSLLFTFILGFLLTIPVVAQQSCADGAWQINGECVISTEVDWSEGWNTVVPGGETMCAHETMFQFWVHPGDENLMVYFQGGGGCWNAETCQQGSSWYKQTASNNEPNRYNTGIFSQRNENNPFANYTVVFVPSCTGDVYMGNAVVEYSDDVTVHHRGFANLMSAVNFVTDTYAEPEYVFVTGCSAGSVGSAIAAPYLMEAYPETPVTQLGDSLGLIFDTPNSLDELWGADETLHPAIDDSQLADAFLMTEYYIEMAEAFPNRVFGQFNNRYERVQQRFFAIGQSNPREFVSEGLEREMVETAVNANNFRYFLDDDSIHCILPNNGLYTAEVDGVALLDWLNAYLAGEAVDNVGG